MKIIAIGAVTAGGKTTVVSALREQLPRAAATTQMVYPIGATFFRLFNQNFHINRTKMQQI